MRNVKCVRTTIGGYLLLLLGLSVVSIIEALNVVNCIYLLVIVLCTLKFIFIINSNK